MKSPTISHKAIGQISDIDIRLLKIFKAVVDNGGFAAAEVQLNISRPAISIAISDLEKRLDLRLCQRGRSGFTLTEEGQEIYNASLQLLVSLETFKTQVNAIHHQLKGELNIGITDNLVTLPHMRITHALAALKKAGPEVRINIRMIPPNDIELGVLDSRLHIGVIPELRPLQGLNYYPLYEETSQLYCSAGHPLYSRSDDELQPEDIYDCDAVVPAFAQIAEIKSKHQLLNSQATATDREGIAFLILTGHFIGYLPTHFAQRWVRDGLMRPLLPRQLYFGTQYSAITRKAARPNLILEKYLEALGV
ncbi:LysR family transcriptional regulator [Pokkaliibacter plantistimulans]|uniref:LysR family transcriptional regulator n=1 Tax=Pokkaliibacter plantistimulans TaxID=1635171 RepID=A0ABX5LQG9_9GAMM|nr:LysR family transcriptional regulator [Pokkaliibacter plantistimulans]PXF28636.1 LysR family transcriptional regulator [Pokkaliibacter plantistimulans]